MTEIGASPTRSIESDTLLQFQDIRLEFQNSNTDESDTPPGRDACATLSRR
jgi:hypothetical protein